MKTIPLTKGFQCIVDDDDYQYLLQWKWHVSVCNGLPYAVRSSKPRPVPMHRMLCEIPKGMQCDHKNRNSLDNRRSNLRAVTSSQQIWNRRIQKHNKLGIKGVVWDRNKFRADIRINNKQIHLGRFDDPQEAGLAYSRAAKELFGEYVAVE